MHRLLGRKRLRMGFAEVVASLGLSCFVVFCSLMIGIDQGIITRLADDRLARACFGLGDGRPETEWLQ